MSLRPVFATRAFLIAGVYGLIALAPQYFMKGPLSLRFPPPVTHPEHFYGFVGVAIAWQFAFFVIARDVQRFRSFMLPAIFEKFSFGAAAPILYARGMVSVQVLCAGGIDLIFAGLFILAFVASRNIKDSKDTEALNQPFISLEFRKTRALDRFL